MLDTIEMLSINQAKELTKLSPFALRRFVNTGALACVRSGKKVFICKAVLMEFLQQNTNNIGGNQNERED